MNSICLLQKTIIVQSLCIWNVRICILKSISELVWPGAWLTWLTWRQYGREFGLGRADGRASGWPKPQSSGARLWLVNIEIYNKISCRFFIHFNLRSLILNWRCGLHGLLQDTRPSVINTCLQWLCVQLWRSGRPACFLFFWPRSTELSSTLFAFLASTGDLFVLCMSVICLGALWWYLLLARLMGQCYFLRCRLSSYVTLPVGWRTGRVGGRVVDTARRASTVTSR